MNFDIIKTELAMEPDGVSQEKFEKFATLFQNYNAHTNLMSKGDVDVLFEKHIYDSLAINLFLSKYSNKKKQRMLDIGTGGGFPSLPVAMAYCDIQVVALDSIAKKIEFIKQAKTALNIDNITPICGRVENLKEKAKFDIVTTRAVADLNVISEYALPYLKVGGYFVAYKSRQVDDEVKNAQKALKILGGKIIDKIEYKLPLEVDFERYLLIIKKESKTPFLYPRLNGQPKKNPL
ncbi:MAG: 16S rRNA (guanine(527)-N(7))-methyltransferase RsmG [Candidatus Gastranaerophilales bacterium]|nr:16S rRNA (guanine(527)-N(7))-methyltransferase RsmG [Candidatus Gastranaerophilales bacterium]